MNPEAIEFKLGEISGKLDTLTDIVKKTREETNEAVSGLETRVRSVENGRARYMGAVAGIAGLVSALGTFFTIHLR